MKIRKFTITRDLSIDECPWFEDQDITELKKGTVVYEFPDLYGCSEDGMTVSFEQAKYPYFEVPEDAIEEVVGIDFSAN